MPRAWAGEYFETKVCGTASLTSFILMLTKMWFLEFDSLFEDVGVAFRVERFCLERARAYFEW
jgi:hypothetical protein